MHLTSAYGLVGYFAASDEALAACTADVDLLNTDDLPVIEYSAPRTRNDELVTRRILLDVQPDVLALLTDLGETPEESGRVRARLLAAHQSNRSVQRAIVALRKGRFIHPLFRSASDRSAVSYCLKAQVLDPTNELASLFLGEAHWFLGATLESEGRLGEALEHKLRGLRLWPDIARLPILEYRKTLAANPGSARTHFDLAVALAGTGKTGEAIQHLGTALRLQPDLPGAASLLSKLQAASGPASTRP